MPDFWERFDPPMYMQTNTTCYAHQISMCKSVNMYQRERGFTQNMYPKIKYFLIPIHLFKKSYDFQGGGE
jgi:hypothetical protein